MEELLRILEDFERRLAVANGDLRAIGLPVTRITLCPECRKLFEPSATCTICKGSGIQREQISSGNSGMN